MNLKIDNLVFEYPSPSQKRIINNLNASFASNKINCLVGANGVGKTTMLALIAGYFDYDYKGNILIDEVSLNSFSCLERAYYVMKIDQDVHTLLVPHLCVGEHLVLANLSNKGGSIFRNALRKSTRNKIIERLLSVGLDMENEWDKRIYQLSGGIQQKVALSMLAIRSPNIALLDEPTANLDAQNGQQCFETLRAIARDTNTVFVIVSHDLSLVSKYADLVYVLKEGIITETIDRPTDGFNPEMIAKEMGLFDD